MVAGAVVIVIAGFALFVGAALHEATRPVPSFPSLAAQPDSSLRGTVAYFANDSGCVRLVAASGQTSKTLWCPAREDSAVWKTLGKPAGPQLAWRPDGRLEVTVFRMVAGKNEPLRAGWQKVIDARTGKVEDVPAAQLPSTPSPTTGPTVSPDGRRVGYTYDASSGRAKVTLTDTTGTRTLLSVHGPGEYTYSFGPVFWAPNGQWIVATDPGRILVITPGTPSATRVLVANSGGGLGGPPAGPAFAVTSADLLTSAK